MVFALGQAGDSDRTDDACAGDVDGEAPAVSSVVGVGKVVAVAEGAAGLLERKADGVGGAVETADNVRFSLHPALIVRCGAGKRGVEERLVWLAEAADVDDDGLFAGESEFAEAETKAPCGVVAEAGEAEFGFLAGDCSEVFEIGRASCRERVSPYV